MGRKMSEFDRSGKAHLNPNIEELRNEIALAEKRKDYDYVKDLKQQLEALESRSPERFQTRLGIIQMAKTKASRS